VNWIKQYIPVVCFALLVQEAFAQTKESENAKTENAVISNSTNNTIVHSTHPDAQWFPDAGLGLFIHWGISSVKDLDASWPMIVGWGIQNKKLDPAEIRRIIEQKDFQKINENRRWLTPNEYWAMAEKFNPENYDPEKWIRAAKAAGFTYAVFTTKHHEGFALWPSAFGNFNTKSFAGGKDLVKPFVDACRKHGLKVGLYYSPPDWYFDKNYRSFLLGGAKKNNPSFPELDFNLEPRRTKPGEEETKKHRAAYAAMIRGQLNELLTNYGKIDLLWFDGKAAIDDPANVMTQEEIRKMQPSVLINPRMHGTGDFKTFERTPPAKDPGNIWAEFCNPWTSSWANSNTIPFRSNAFILGQFVTMRSWTVNYLLSVGPKADGSLPDAVYTNMKVIQSWMKEYAKAIKNVTELPQGDSCSVPATSHRFFRYLFLVPEFENGSMYEEDRIKPETKWVTYYTKSNVRTVRTVPGYQPLTWTKTGDQILIRFPASMQKGLVDVIQLEVDKDNH
jgi:alpha-L-fucosidase